MSTCPKCRKQFDDGVGTCPDDGTSLVDDAVMDASGIVDETLARGTEVGEYRIEKQIGAGAYGAVYSAEHPLIGKRAAIKVLHRKFASEIQIVSRFISEARAVNRIRHRNIIDVFSFGRLPDQRQYLIMELLHGQTLRQLLDERGRLGIVEAFPILKGVGAALDAAHAEGVAHRDLKPDNVFVARDRDGTLMPKLLDFGVAKLTGDDDVKHKTATGTAIGTPLYMSPEQCRGRGVDHRADLYSFGVVIFETLTGTFPFDGEAAVEVLFKHMTDTPPRMSSVARDVPPALDAVVDKLLAKRPKDRYQSAAAALEALAEAAKSAGLAVGTTSDLPPAQAEGRPSANATLRVTPVGQSMVETSDAMTTGPSSEALSSAETVALEGADRGTGTMPEAGVSKATARSGDAAKSLTALEAPSSRRRGGGVKLAVAALAVAGAAGFWFVRSSSDSASNAFSTEATEATAPSVTEEATPPAPSIAHAASTTVEPSAAALETVEITLATQPDDVEVWLDERRLGTSGAPVVLPRGSAPVALRLVKAGFKPQPLEVTPERDQSLTARLSPLAAPAGARPAQPATKPAAKPSAGTGSLDSLLGDRD